MVKKKVVYEGYNEAYANERFNELTKYGHKAQIKQKGKLIKVYRI